MAEAVAVASPPSAALAAPHVAAEAADGSALTLTYSAALPPSGVAIADVLARARARGVKWYAEAGDVVIIYGEGIDLLPITLTVGGAFDHRVGHFDHSDMIGCAYGSKIFTRSRVANFIYMLPFTPELWTLSLPHRTQILYSVDIAAVIQHLCLRPGLRVVETGTGSGSLTTSLARAVWPHGHVYTFEFNADRVEKAIAEFRQNGIADVVTVTQADAYADGFGAALNDSIDGVFFDLPRPWEALHHAKAVMKPGATICSFSPCIEQVQQCCERMAELGFQDIRTIETLLRAYDVLEEDPAPPAIGGLFDGEYLETPPQLMVRSAPAPPAAPGKRAADEEALEGGDADKVPRSAEPAAAAATNGASTGASTAAAAPASAPPAPAPAVRVPAPTPKAAADGGAAKLPRRRFPPHMRDRLPMALRPKSEAKGHTGYLTFAKLYRK